MIVEYARPQTIEQAVELLKRPGLRTIPIGGGSALDRASSEPLAVVDLQALGLDQIVRRGNFLDLGATVTLQALSEHGDTPPALRDAIRFEASYNLRQVATVAGTLVAADGRSPFAAVMLALDAVLSLAPSGEAVGLGDVLPVRSERLRGKLITRVTIPLNTGLAYQSVARSPSDRPIVCAALARWPSGRTRLALGGFGSVPFLALDGPEPGGIETAARNAFSAAGDEWASAEYRQDAAAVLAKRCYESL
jgi:putative selenate reductase FAD-binding subunit